MECAPGAELLASRPGELIRFTDFNPDVVDAGCAPSCPLSTSVLPVPWLGSGAIQTRRLFTRGASMFVAFADDAGVPALLERSPGGSWGARLSPPGRPIQSAGQLEALSYDGGAIDRWRWDTSTRQWNATERVASGLSGAEELAGNERQVTAFIGPTRQLAIWTFGVNGSVSPLPAWYQVPAMPSGPPTAGVNTSFTSAGTISGFFYNRPNGSLGLYRTGDTENSFVFPPTRDFTFGGNPTAVVQGYDSVTRGRVIVAVRAENGDIRLSLMTYSQWGGGVDQPFEGPTRPGPPPYTQVLDVNPVCEAAWPRLALVNDAVIVTWQERCAPETRWRVVMRLVR